MRRAPALPLQALDRRKLTAQLRQFGAHAAAAAARKQLTSDRAATIRVGRRRAEHKGGHRHQRDHHEKPETDHRDDMVLAADSLESHSFDLDKLQINEQYLIIEAFMIEKTFI
ncbi:hypothetical protein MesoLj131c_14080 [Mesorhizobium sp. 131-3-5]|nr:hypothetical protein MesoLj131c_14080 [Mesorhizobium sp. 131-3-5]